MDIVEKSNTTLRRIEQNDPKLTSLAIVNQEHTASHPGDNTRGYFWVHNGADLSRLGNAIANNTRLEGRISLFKSSEWTLDTRSLLEGLQRNTTVKELWLHGGIDDNVLSEYVANNSNLTRIGITQCDLRGDVAGSLVQGIKKCQKLKDIIVFYCNIDGASVKQFALGIKGMSSLQRLEIISDMTIDGGGIDGIDGIECAESIVNLLQDPSCNINHLGLNDTGLNNESVLKIVRSLRGNTKLERLTLSYNSITIQAAEEIGSLLQDPNCNLIQLDLGSCGMNNESTQIIVSSLIGNTKLVKLDLSSSIGMSGCESIVTLLQDPNCNLASLNLGYSGIKNDMATKIVRSLIGNTKLVKLDLSGNSIGRAGCESIATLLQDRNSNINEIELSRNEIDDVTAALLAQALVGNNKLKCLDLSGNSGITESGWNAFSAILTNCSNHTLCSLGDDYSGKDFVPNNLASLLKLNLAVNMEPLFELDSEDNERKPKALPSVIDWFGRIRESNQNDEVVKSIGARKLSAIFQFARTMPMQFVPASHFTHPSVVSLIQLKEDRDNALERKYRELQQRNSELEKQVVAKDTEIASMREAKEKSDDVLKAKEDEIKDLYGRLDSIVNVARPKRKFPWD